MHNSEERFEYLWAEAKVSFGLAAPPPGLETALSKVNKSHNLRPVSLEFSNEGLSVTKPYDSRSGYSLRITLYGY